MRIKRLEDMEAAAKALAEAELKKALTARVHEK